MHIYRGKVPQNGVSGRAARRKEPAQLVKDAVLKERIGRLSVVTDARRAGGEMVEVLVELGETFEAPGDHVLLREGDVRGTTGYVLLEGCVAILKSGREPVPVDAPALLGEMQQFSISGSRSASVTTQGACTLLRFDWPAFYRVLEARLRPLDFQAVKDAIRRHSSNNAFDLDAE